MAQFCGFHPNLMPIDFNISYHSHMKGVGVKDGKVILTVRDLKTNFDKVETTAVLMVRLLPVVTLFWVL